MYSDPLGTALSYAHQELGNGGPSFYNIVSSSVLTPEPISGGL